MERGHESDACHDSVKYMGQKIPAFGLLDQKQLVKTKWFGPYGQDPYGQINLQEQC